MHEVSSNFNTPFSEMISEVAEQAKLLYDISPLSKSTLLSFEKNAEFLIEDKKNGLYTLLRIAMSDCYKNEEIESEIHWIKELSKHGLPFMLPEIIAGLDGDYIQQVKLSNGGIYYCTMFAYLRGRPLAEMYPVELPLYFTKLGECTALLHQNAIQWDRAHTLSREVWDFERLLGSRACFGLWHPSSVTSINGALISKELCLIFDRATNLIKHRLSHFGKSGARFGLIHAALTTSNVLLYKNRLAITRFEDCGFGWFLYDFASSVSRLDDDTQLPQLSAAWLKGYRRQRNISNEESEELPTFVLLRRLVQICLLINSFNNSAPLEFCDKFVLKTKILAEKYIAEYS